MGYSKDGPKGMGIDPPSAVPSLCEISFSFLFHFKHSFKMVVVNMLLSGSTGSCGSLCKLGASRYLFYRKDCSCNVGLSERPFGKFV